MKSRTDASSVRQIKKEEELVECLLQVNRHGLIARSILKLNFNGRFFFTPLEFINVGVRSGFKRAGLEVELSAGRGGVDEDRILILISVSDVTGLYQAWPRSLPYSQICSTVIFF